MKDFELPIQEIQALRLAHKAAKNKADAYRINTVILLGSGWSLEEVSEALLLDAETLRNYVNNYKIGGINKLLKYNYKGGISLLSVELLMQLTQELDKNIYLTTKDICAYVANQFNIKYTISGMTVLLHRIGYVYKKPKLVPGNPDVDAQEYFLKKYLKFMETKKGNDAVFFIDAVHPTWNTMAAYGWIKKGTIRELKTNSGRDRLNIHGAMNAETFETSVIISKSNVNSDSTINLFQFLEKTHPYAENIYVILDNAKYHYSASVREYCETSRIRLVFLPSYSPELNLIERLWRVFKKNVLYNKTYETFKKFQKACMNFFHRQKDHFDEIESIMGDGLEALI